MNTKKHWPWILITLFITAISSLYLLNFHDHKLSGNPSDWGAIGDYFGGLVNPLASLVALYFLIKTYLSQTEELSETKAALKASAIHNEASARAQTELARLQTHQLNILHINSQIEALYKEVSFYLGEIERCTNAKNNNWYTFDAEGRRLSTDTEMDAYRSKMFKNVAIARALLEQLNSQLKNSHTLFAEQPT
ncbi:hypothetical protein ACW9H6_25630 [Pseudomonas sp. SDO528_S397]